MTTITTMETITTTTTTIITTTTITITGADLDAIRGIVEEAQLMGEQLPSVEKLDPLKTAQMNVTEKDKVQHVVEGVIRLHLKSK